MSTDESSPLPIGHPPRPPALVSAVEHVGHLLPAQGPISVFIHHNTLHAFEDSVFEEAVVRSSTCYGCEPFLPEETYRDRYREGRILERDIRAVLELELGDRGRERIVGPVTRAQLWDRLLTHGFPEAQGISLRWLVSETAAVARFRDDLPGEAREALCGGGSPGNVAGDEHTRARELWRACLNAVARSHRTAGRPVPPPLRHRDLLLAAGQADIDAWVHPLLIRFTSAYLDQGLADWPMPDRERGMYVCFREILGRPLATLSGSWASSLPSLLADDLAQARDSWTSLAHSLTVLGIPAQEWEAFLVEEALALRGWAGMVRQFETRPDRVPTLPLPARLVDFLAIRLLLLRSALAPAAAAAGLRGPLSGLRAALAAQLPARAEPTVSDRAWPLFHAAQLCGLDAAALSGLAEATIASLEAELERADALTRRRLLHLAYERHLRYRFYDALVQNTPSPPPARPPVQAIFCIDEREESFRRHLEEVAPSVETFGVAGFFGVAMYYRSATDAHPRPLCPVSLHPEHYVAEGREGPHGFWAWRRATAARIAALVGKNVHIGSHRFGRGALLMATLGVLWVVPLVLRVLFPWSRRGITRVNAALTPSAQTRLDLERSSDVPPLGRYSGFTAEEMTRIVYGQLAPLGIVDRLAPLVFVFGHGSSSLNNPQESAHDCGACGGGRGGPNARAFAQMANDHRVRAGLAAMGMPIPTGTWFVGGERNTATNDLVLFDEDLVPDGLRAELGQAKAALERARSREAHERCRRFAGVPSWWPPRAALVHVQARATDLAQPRPEYGHATNAACVIGRRARTRHLFLDRRVFLVSYDPTHDPDGAILSRLLAAVVPVVAGISLEYFFGYIDPTGYGCGTKLPHNVTGLLGVMDGAQSDLRTGLPWQMLEIHEPVRLTIAVETPPDVLQRILQQQQDLRRLVENRWIFLAALRPDSSELWEMDSGGAKPYMPEYPLGMVAGSSQRHYKGRRGHLPFVRIVPPLAPAARDRA